MKNILILADGSIARHFIEWVSYKRVAKNKYCIVCQNSNMMPEKSGKNISFIKADPTSYSKMKNIMDDVKYSLVFVVMDAMEESRYALKNIRLIDKKIRVVLLNQWDNIEMARMEENVIVVYRDELIAAHLYSHLPNVPVVAQNIGLGQGEIMEILVPFGSAYAYRHVGSIMQRKWKIAAIYREEKQILPTNATMVYPNDTLLVLGKPIVLDGVYKMINKRIGLFPEPFGKNLYLLLDLRVDSENALLYLQESVYLANELEDKSLYVRVLYPNNFELIEALKKYESANVTLSICYDDKDIKTLVEYDIQQYDIGLVLSSLKTFESKQIKTILYALKKLVYLFGDKQVYNIKEAIVLMNEKEKMESISSTAFDFAEELGIKLTLADFDPEGDFEAKKMVIEHYETMAQIFNTEIHLEQKVANPIREIERKKQILQIVPFEKELIHKNFLYFLSTKSHHFLLATQRHPKLLVPFEASEG
ncbi:MAG: uncharacterized protein QG564_366 [Campylobacterota bacterium]|nr:uncharacterized protein [Campylobacterota bacterium]